MNDGFQRSPGRRATDATDLAAENERLCAMIVDLENMNALEQALRRGLEAELAMYRRRAAQTLDARFDEAVQ